MLSLRPARAIRLMVLLLAALLALPLAWGLATLDERKLARALRRDLAPAPGLADLAADPMAALAGGVAWAADRTAGVLWSARALTRMRYDWLGDSGAPTTVRNGEFVFLTDNTAEAGRAFAVIAAECHDPAGWRGWSAELLANSRRIARALERPGRRVAFLAVPSKPVLYPDRLPPAVPPALRADCALAARGAGLDAWAAALTAEGIAAAHPLAPMRAMRDRPGFYPPQNFHAAGAGAHVAAWALLDMLFPGRYPPGSVPLALAPGEADMRNIYGYARPIELLAPDYGPRRPLFDWRRARGMEKAERAIPAIRLWINADRSATGKAVVIGNSFGLHVTEHLAPAYAETVFYFVNGIRPAGLDRLLGPLLEAQAPDHVIFLFHDGVMKTDRLAEIAARLPAAE